MGCGALGGAGGVEGCPSVHGKFLGGKQGAEGAVGSPLSMHLALPYDWSRSHGLETSELIPSHSGVGGPSSPPVLTSCGVSWLLSPSITHFVLCCVMTPWGKLCEDRDIGVLRGQISS